MQAGILFSVFKVLTYIPHPLHSPSKTLCLPDELYCFRIHCIGRFGFHWALFHCISTLNKWQSCFGIIQSLSKLFHLINRVNTGSSLSIVFKMALSHSLYALFEKRDFWVPKPCEWSPEKKNRMLPSLVIFANCYWFRVSEWMVVYRIVPDLCKNCQSELLRTAWLF